MTTGCGTAITKMKKSVQKPENCEDAKPEEVLPMRITHIPPFLIEEARRELNETDEVRKKCLAEFRRLIAGEKKLVCPTDDTFLLAFLRARKFNVKKAFKLFQNFFSFRKEHKHVYDNPDVEKGKSFIMRNIFGLLQNRDKKGSMVILMKIGLWDPELDKYDDVFRTITAILHYTLEMEANHIAGFRAIFDLRGITWKQLKYCTPSNLLLITRSTQFCFPGRYKAIHVLSESKTLNMIWAMISPFLTSKVKKRVMFHAEDPKELSNYIHPSVLPKEYGGQAPTFDNTAWEDEIESSVGRVVSFLVYGYKD